MSGVIDKITCNNVNIKPIPFAEYSGIPDTDAISHYIDQSSAPACTSAIPIMPNEGPSAVTASGGELTATTRVNVPMASELSQVATQGHIMNSLQTGTLISIGQLCYDDCVAIFSKYN